MIRPQPVGVLPLPAGGLLVPDVPGAAEVVASLAKGVVPAEWPAGLEFYALAAGGDASAALALLDGTDPVTLFNTVVLAPERYPSVRPLLAPELQVLLDATAFTEGLLDTAPDPGNLDGELRAVVLLTQAADAMEHGSTSAVRGLLVQAVEAARPVLPALAAQLIGTLASLDPATAPQVYAEALSLLPTGHQTQVRAELLYDRANALQATADGRPGVLKEAVRCYQQALVVFRRESHPQLFAEAQTNLALCHLGTPMAEAGDHLRLGVAVQALRDALTVWDRESFPQEWASVTLNLANALQYLPSAHQEDNLVEAVEYYEQLLELRDPEVDPVGYARVLANQGNALAHLGITEHAQTKLLEASELFTNVGDLAAAESIGATLVELEALTMITKETA